MIFITKLSAALDLGPQWKCEKLNKRLGAKSNIYTIHFEGEYENVYEAGSGSDSEHVPTPSFVGTGVNCTCSGAYFHLFINLKFKLKYSQILHSHISSAVRYLSFLCIKEFSELG